MEVEVDRTHSHCKLLAEHHMLKLSRMTLVCNLIEVQVARARQALALNPSAALHSEPGMNQLTSTGTTLPEFSSPLSFCGATGYDAELIVDRELKLVGLEGGVTLWIEVRDRQWVLG